MLISPGWTCFVSLSCLPKRVDAQGTNHLGFCGDSARSITLSERCSDRLHTSGRIRSTDFSLHAFVTTPTLSVRDIQSSNILVLTLVMALAWVVWGQTPRRRTEVR